MKIRSLTLQGIGPFAGQHTVDFAAFDEAGLFLLEGPTGSGKSSIIDALVFALYGRVSGGMDSAEQRLRSTYCGDDQVSRVALLFETGSGIYEVVRTPGYQPSGRKTPKPSSVRLDRVTLAEDGSVVSREGMAAKKAEVDQEILGLIGLDAQQFRQTVVLPQGEFSAFLMAGSEERRKILQDIFGTGFYVDIQTTLQQRARESREAVAEAKAKTLGQLESLLQSLDDTTEVEAVQIADFLRDVPEDLEGLEQLPTMFAAATTAAAATELELEAEVASRTRVEAASGEQVAEAERAATLVGQRRDLEDDLTKLEDEAPRIEELDHQLKGARSAAAPLRAYRGWQAADTAKELAEKGFASTREGVLHLLESPAGELVDIGPIDDVSSDLLAEQLSDIARASGSLQELFLQERKMDGLAERIAEDEARLEKLRDQERAESGKVREARIKAEQVEAILQNGERLREEQELLHWAQKAALVREELEESLRIHGELAEAATLAGQAENEMRNRWLSASVGAVAAELREGHPCPVCGSLEHPHPAPLSEETVSLELVNQATERRQAADRLLQDSQVRVTQAETQLQPLADVPPLSAAELKQRQQEVDRRWEEYRQAEEAKESFVRQISQGEDSVKALQLDIAGAEPALAEAKAQREEIAQTLQVASRPFATLKGKEQALEELAARIGALAEAQRTLRDARVQEATAREDLERQAQAAGYSPDAEGYAQILSDALPDAEMASLSERITDHRTRQRQVREQLAKLQVDPGMEELVEQLPTLRSRHAEGRQLREEKQRELAYWQGEQKALRQQFDAAASLLSQWRRQGELAGPVVRLAALANANGSENLLKTPLASYVLMRRLDEVLDATNPRLREFSNHHYELVRQAEGRDGNRKTGLGLEILDNETGQRRPPGTLSGGEVFYTSLALALGLAEIVTAEAGGFDLGTVFIDEGFGSLDSETLDVVMKHLEDLRSGGRTIGVVSHVAEMQSRISEGIRVRRLGAGQGSTLSLRG